MRYVKAVLTKQSAVSAGVGALLILILTSAVIASSMLQGGSARRAATSGSVGGIGSPSNAGSHVTFSLTPTAGTGAQSTPSVSPTPQAGPTGGPGGHHVDPGSPGNPGSGGGSPSPTPTAGPTVPPAPGVTPTPTNVPTPTLPEYDAKPVGPTTPVTVDNPVLNHFITLTVQNTGTATWKSPFGSNPGPFIYLHCLSDCGFDPDPFVTGPDVAPGQLFTYAYAYRVFPGATHHPHFMMEVNDVFIGPEMVLSVIDSTEMPVSTQQAPTCDNTAGASWVTLNAGGGNTIACTASGLLMQQGALASPEANLVSLTGLTPDNFDIHVHVHFADTTESAFAGFALRVQPQDTCGGYRFLVRPDGAFEIFIQFVTASGCTSAPPFLQGKVAASADFDLTYLESFGAGYWYLNHTVLGDGGVTTFTGVDGLTVLDSSNSASPVYFSQFSVNNQVPEYMQYWLSAP